MINHFYSSQLDIIGFTAEYRLLLVLIGSMLIVTFILIPCIRILVKLRYSALLGFMVASCLLTIAILLLERHIAIGSIDNVWIKSMAAYSFLCAVILFGSYLRKKIN